MLTKEQFNAMFGASQLLPGQTYESLVQFGRTLCNVIGIPYILEKSVTPFTRNSTNTTGTGGVDDNEEVELARIIIPSGVLAGRNSLWFHALCRNTGGASTKTYRPRVNGTAVGAKNVTGNLAPQFAFAMHANNAPNSQKYPNNMAGDFSVDGATMIDGSADGSADVIFTFTGAWGAAANGEFMTIEEYMMIVYPG